MRLLKVRVLPAPRFVWFASLAPGWSPSPVHMYVHYVSFRFTLVPSFNTMTMYYGTVL